MSQILAVIVGYFDKEKQDVVNALLDIVKVKSETAKNLYRSRIC